MTNKINNNHGAIITSPDRKADSPETRKVANNWLQQIFLQHVYN